jgi:hypothetical protein
MDLTAAGDKRSREGFALNETGLAVDFEGKLLSVQPPDVFAQYMRGHKGAPANAHERYEASGIFQTLDTPTDASKSARIWCNICASAIACHVDKGKVQTTTKLRHLRTMHKDFVLPEEAKTPFTVAAAAAAAAEAAAAAAAATAAPKPAPVPSISDDALFDKLADLIAAKNLADGLPANSVSHVGQRYELMELVNLIKPDYAKGIPSRQTVDVRMTQMAKGYMDGLGESIKLPVFDGWLPSKFSLIIDKWDDGYGNDILGVVVKYVDTEFTFRSEVVAAMRCAENTGPTVRAKVEEALKRVGLDYYDCIPTSDAGQPMPSVFKVKEDVDGVIRDPREKARDRAIEESWLWCVSHAMQKALEAASTTKVAEDAPVAAHFTEILDLINILVGQVLASNKRRTTFRAAQAAATAMSPGTTFATLKAEAATRWTSQYNKVASFNNNMAAFDLLDPTKLSFRDKDKKAEFDAALGKFKGWTEEQRKSLHDLERLLRIVSCANQLSQSDGVTFHLLKTVTDQLLEDLVSFSGAEDIVSIAKLIGKQLAARYVQKYPEITAVAMYFAPETAYNLYEAASLVWDKTTSSLALKWIVNEITFLYSGVAETEAKAVPLPPSIREMTDSTKKNNAVNAHVSREKQERMKDLERRAEKEFGTMLKFIAADVYEARGRHNEAEKAYDKSMLEWKAAKVGPEPASPSYVPIDILEWWKTRAAQFPLMAQMARWMCAISISGAEVERVFSRGSLVLPPHRNRLGAEKEELYLMASYNITRAWKKEKRLGGMDERGVVMSKLFPGVDLDEEEGDE